jgi:hypothetical protein
MFFATFLIATGGSKAMLVGWAVQESDPMSRLQPSQRMRYFYLAIGGAICFGSVAYIIALYGWSMFVRGTEQWFGLPLIGWVVGVCVWFGLFSPLLIALTARHIYRHPAAMAKRVRGGWVATRDVRKGTKPLPVYRVEKIMGGRGIVTKCYRPTGGYA